MALSGDVPNVDLRAYATALWRRKVLIFFCVAMVVGTAMFFSYRKTPLYRASARILLQSRLREQVLGSGALTYVDPIRSQKTEIQIITSPPVQAEVERQLGRAGGVSARPLVDTDIIFIDAVDEDPRRAAETANAYVDAYIAFRHKQAVDDLTAAGAEVQTKIADLQKQIDALRASLPPPAVASSASGGAAAAASNPQIEALVNQQVVLGQKLNQIQVDTALNSGGAQPVAPATAPAAPFTPNHKRDAMLAIAVGLLFGVGMAFLWEFLDDTIDGQDALERAVPDLPTLAAIPPVRGWKNAAKPMVVSITDPDSAPAEAYRTLRTAIQFARLDKQLTVLQVTSAAPGEGKSATVANLAVALARAGTRVIVVCCDLRRPRIHEFFGLKTEPGFTSVLLGEVSLSDALQETPQHPRIRVLASGPIAPNPSELLSSERTGGLIAALRHTDGVVLVDSPPILPVTDPAVIARHVDATLLVASVGLTTRRQLHRALALLRRVDAPVMGTVINGAVSDESYGYSYAPYKASAGPRNSSNGGPGVNGKENGHRPDTRSPRRGGRKRASPN